MKRREISIAALIVALAALLLAACSSGGGGGAPQQTSVNLARTGQTVCYDAAGAVVACAGTGQDGDKLAGVAWPIPRFTNPDGTAEKFSGSVVVDQLTGLMWLRAANCISTNYASFDNDGTAGDGAVTWQHALDFVAGINAGTYPNCGGGYTDWRLPNRNELGSLSDYSRSNPALQSGHPFTGVQTSMYWSSTTSAGVTTDAWEVDMSTGWVNDRDKTVDFFVWPVR